MTLSEIQELIKLVSRSSVNEVEIEKKDFKISIKAEGKKKGNGMNEVVAQQFPMAMPQLTMPQMQAAPATAPVAQAPAAPAAPAAEDAKYITIKSPMIGTFYRRPSPDKDLFVNVGDDVKAGTVVCVIEAMKLFNEIESEISGKIVKILVDDSSPVEYDQPLFLVDPA